VTEPTFGPEAWREAVEAAGARFRGLQARRDRPPLLLFDDPATGSTLTVDVAALVTEAVRARLGERPEAVVLGVVGARVVEQLDRLAGAVEGVAQQLGRQATPP